MESKGRVWKQAGGKCERTWGEEKTHMAESPVVPRLPQAGTDSAVVCLVRDQRRGDDNLSKVDSNPGRERAFQQ